MAINFTIWEKAKRIIKENEDERKYVYACKLAGICPECGEKLTYKHDPWFISHCTKCNWRY